ncbi:hypothetical protein CPLU01_00415 [Colletotrichum plurivorum]|uniref:Uncharacterized protein n=1 Tax=Colletotrichum plurivorum TaxID=2175906 RepID=A0A8H6NSP1_9PEZI|nr:hypothetical protein CPLU01_00415 [Colletotrichum plurivorum]
MISSRRVTARPFRRPLLGSRKLAAAWRTANEARPPRWALYDRHGIRRDDTLPQRVVANRKQEIYSGVHGKGNPFFPFPSHLFYHALISDAISPTQPYVSRPSHVVAADRTASNDWTERLRRALQALHHNFWRVPHDVLQGRHFKGGVTLSCQSATGCL